jgi:hypothetical protein
MTGKARTTVIIGLFLILLGALCCSLLEEKEHRFVRIIDTLSEQNIIESPLKNLIQQFNLVQEEIKGQWKHIPELSTQDQEIWGYSTRYSILGNHESESPEAIELFENSKEVKYLSNSVKKKIGWRWIATEETLDLRQFPGYDN